MESSETMTERQAMASDLHRVGVLYAHQAQTLSNIAMQMEQMASVDSEEFPLDASEARSRANFAAVCANFMASAAHRVQTGDYDWEFLQMLSRFTEEEAVLDDPTTPAAS